MSEINGAHVDSTSAPIAAAAAAAVVDPGLVVLRPSAASLKAHIFSPENKRLKTVVVKFFGVDVEIKQRNLVAAFGVSDALKDMEPAERPLYILLNDVFVPGTDENVFDAADLEQLKSLPSDDNYERVFRAWSKLNNIDVEQEEKNSKKTLTDSK